MSGIDWGTEALLGSVTGSGINDPGPNTNSGTDRCNYPHSVARCHLSSSSSSSSSSSLPFPLFRLSHPVWLADQLREEWGVNGWLHQWTLIVHLQGALGPRSSYLETWWQMSLKIVAMRHRFPGNCSRCPALSLSVCLSSLSCFSLSTHDLLSPPQHLIQHDDLYLSIFFTPTQRRCAVERCIDCLIEAPELSLTRNSKDTAA